MGVLQVHLSGGEPASRRDLVEIVAAARDAGLYTNLITSAIGLDPAAPRAAEGGGPGSRAAIAPGRGCGQSRTASPAIPARTRASSAFAQSVVELGLALTVNAVIHRANIDQRRRAGRNGRVARRRAGGDRPRAVLRLGVAQPAGADADARAGRRARCRRWSKSVRGIAGRLVIDLVVPDYYARRPKACMGGWATSLAERHAVRPRAAVPRRRDHSRPAVLVGARPAAGGDLAEFSGVPGIPRHRLDARAVPVLRAARNRLRRLPLPGAGDRGRRGGDRSGVRTVAASRTDAGACRTGVLAAPSTAYAYRGRVAARRRYCHSSSLNAAVALRAL